ncbi:MAG: Peptide methionine sulfoxide reductase msrA [Gammaproteobacteria bacterium]|jgi:peptide-methionine (S)-S-oxide reductase|nr:Peptide methionine sulfoxide reductase msrA [Gammaproteobacteria bacterium]
MSVQQATFAAGCFWGVEAAFRKVHGVIATQVGFMGGHTPQPSYLQVCNGDTGHAEVVYVQYNAAQVSYSDLLEVFWAIHDPTTYHRQGPDIGSQYRSAIFYYNGEQKQIAEQSLQKLAQSGTYPNKIVTEIVPASTFYPAEEYHQRYYEKQGIAGCRLKG